MRKKLFSIVLSLAIVVTMIPMTAVHADEQINLQDSFEIIFNDSKHLEYTGEPVKLVNYAVVDIKHGIYDWEEYMDRSSKWRAENSLVEGTDYTVSYKNNIEPGTATMIITGTGKYTGTLEISFAIYEKYIDATVKVNKDRSVTIKPAEKFDITKAYVEYPSFKLVKGRDYKILSNGSVKLTTAFLDSKTGFKMKERGKYNNIDFKSKHYIMTAYVGFYNIKYMDRYAVSTKRVYNGKQKSVSKHYGLIDCKRGVDYKIVYDKKTRKKIGRYYFTVKSLGNNVGTFRSHFDIVPKSPSEVRATRTSSKAKIQWKKVKNCTGYQVQLLTNQPGDTIDTPIIHVYKSVKIKGKDKSSKTFKSVKKSKYNDVRVRAYKIVKGKYYYSSWTNNPF